MQLALTALGANQTNFLPEIIRAISECQCKIIDIRCSRLANATAAHLLIDSNWNHIARLERMLELLESQLNINIHKLRPESQGQDRELLPYSLETVSIYQDGLLQDILAFLNARSIIIDEMTGSSYQAAYLQTQVFSTKFVLFIPAGTQLLSLREEFLDFCDQMNIDAILEPIKR